MTARRAHLQNLQPKESSTSRLRKARALTSTSQPDRLPDIGIDFFLRFIYLFLERGREGEREGKKHQCVVASHVPPTGDLARNPGMCPRLGIVLVTL